MRRVVAVLFMVAFSATANAGDLRRLEPESFAAIKQAYAGRKVIVHFWGLSCSICLAELAEWGRFASAHSDAALVLINWDPRGQETRIAGMLEKSGLAAAENWMLGSGYEEKLRFRIDREWIGELPRTLLLNSDGATTIKSGAANFDELSRWVAP